MSANGPSAIGKYGPLHDHLSAAPGDEFALTFAQIEQIIGGVLPPSARRPSSWWSNTMSRVQGKAWLTAGWRVASVDTQLAVVVFRKRQPRACRHRELAGTRVTRWRDLTARAVDLIDSVESEIVENLADDESPPGRDELQRRADRILLACIAQAVLEGRAERAPD